MYNSQLAAIGLFPYVSDLNIFNAPSLYIPKLTIPESQ